MFVKCVYLQSCQLFVVAILIFTTNIINALHTLETPIREALLKPRNFNPHPYEQSYQNLHVAPQSAINLNAIDTDYVENSVYNIDIDNSLPARHPSNSIFSQAPHQFPPTLPPGQNIHDASHPYAPLKYKHDIDHEPYYHHPPKKQYAFSYTVRDKHSGDDFSHTQQQKNGAVKGTYKVQLPDGRTQVVRYTADGDGYRADVSYLFDKNAVNNVNDGNGFGYEQEQERRHQHYHHLNSYNPIAQVNINGLPTSPDPTPSSTIFVSTAKPPVDIHRSEPSYLADKLNLEQRQSISAQPTYVLSPKSTHIDDNIRIVPNAGYIDDNSIAIRSDSGLYYKNPQHHSVFYEAR